MWLYLPDCFLSIVQDKHAAHQKVVRARFKGDIEKMFPNAEVEEHTGTDYRFRAYVNHAEVVSAMVHFTDLNINYHNFKDENHDEFRHRHLMEVWNAMLEAQEEQEYKEDDNEFLTFLNH